MNPADELIKTAYASTLPAPNEGQAEAINKILTWLDDPLAGPFFLLEGGAGTGKTFVLRHVQEEYKRQTVFTAPTNKATRVIREALSENGTQSPECCTIYSLLSLKLEANGEIKTLRTPEKPVDMNKIRFVVVDEAMMLNEEVLSVIERTSSSFKHVKWLFMGDEAQLPPVKYTESPVVKFRGGPCHYRLTKVERFDNQLLSLATELRLSVEKPYRKLNLQNDNDGETGVWVLTGAQLRHEISRAALAGNFDDGRKAKAIAWRNAEVDVFNTQIRLAIHGSGVPTWVRGDRFILTSPAKDLDDQLVASTDEEGTVVNIEVDRHPIFPEFKIWRLQVDCDFEGMCQFMVLHEDSRQDFVRRTNELASSAKVMRKLWKDYWEFQEAFHQGRHGYAITAHRAQGSTYDTVYVNYRDILTNPERTTAFRCLYVAASRAKRRVYLG